MCSIICNTLNFYQKHVEFSVLLICIWAVRVTTGNAGKCGPNIHFIAKKPIWPKVLGQIPIPKIRPQTPMTCTFILWTESFPSLEEKKALPSCGNKDGNIINVLKKCISISVATVFKCMKWLYPYVIGVWWWVFGSTSAFKEFSWD